MGGTGVVEEGSVEVEVEGVEEEEVRRAVAFSCFLDLR